VHLPAVLAEAGLATSNAEGRRLIDQGGVRVDGVAVGPRAYDILWTDIDGRVLQVGKRRYARVRAK
jgi:tyrosyl-tRNA synthetase